MLNPKTLELRSQFILVFLNRKENKNIWINIPTLPLLLFFSFPKTIQRQLVIILISAVFKFWKHKNTLSQSEFISRKSKGRYKNMNSAPFPELSPVLDQQTCFHLYSIQKRNELNWWCLYPAVIFSWCSVHLIVYQSMLNGLTLRKNS